jgi:hypothetical protein
LAGSGLHDESLSGSMRRIGQCDASEAARSCALGWIAGGRGCERTGGPGRPEEEARPAGSDCWIWVKAARLAPGSTGPTGAASCGARVGSIPGPLAVARRRPASSACAELANTRCAAAGRSRPALVSARAFALSPDSNSSAPCERFSGPPSDRSSRVPSVGEARRRALAVSDPGLLVVRRAQCGDRRRSRPSGRRGCRTTVVRRARPPVSARSSILRIRVAAPCARAPFGVFERGSRPMTMHRWGWPRA